MVNCFILHPALFLEGEVNKGKIVGYTIHSWGCGVICSHTHACTCMQSHACTHSHTHTRTHSHTDTHTCTHTHTKINHELSLIKKKRLKTIYLKDRKKNLPTDGTLAPQSGSEPRQRVAQATTPPMHMQDGSGWGQVPPLG